MKAALKIGRILFAAMACLGLSFPLWEIWGSDLSGIGRLIACVAMISCGLQIISDALEYVTRPAAEDAA